MSVSSLMTRTRARCSFFCGGVWDGVDEPTGINCKVNRQQRGRQFRSGRGGDNTAVLLSCFQATSKPTVSHTFYWLLPNCITGCKWGTGLWIVACCQTLEKNLLNNAVRPPLMSTRLLIQFPLCCKRAQWVWQRKVHQKKKLTFN